LSYAIKNRCGKYGMDKSYFDKCENIDQINEKVAEYLLSKGFNRENVKRLINRPTTYKK
jgi:SOS response regulatory protein OraA/RecX